MKESRQREEMAKLAGFQMTVERSAGESVEVWTSPLFPFKSSLPDFLNDGDAARAVARKLSLGEDEGFITKFEFELAKIVLRRRLNCQPFDYATVFPSEITEATLRAAGVWEEKE